MFIEEYLQDLRRERYSLPAWLHYARRVAAHVRRDLLANPLAVRSIWTVALAYFGVAFAAAVWMSLTLIGTARGCPPPDRSRPTERSSITSTKEFHSLQSGQRPIHLSWTEPHCWQTN